MRKLRLEPYEIRILRQSLGMSQDTFGRLFDRTKSTIFRWETGQYEPHPAEAAALVLIWNRVQRQTDREPAYADEKLVGFAEDLIAEGIFGYLTPGS